MAVEFGFATKKMSTIAHTRDALVGGVTYSDGTPFWTKSSEQVEPFFRNQPRKHVDRWIWVLTSGHVKEKRAVE
jgi:hypothetical protein